jgi:hypothetical protein
MLVLLKWMFYKPKKYQVFFVVATNIANINNKIGSASHESVYINELSMVHMDKSKIPMETWGRIHNTSFSS